MAYEGPMVKLAGVIAGADLRTSAQFRFVKLSADNTVILCTAITDKPIGVLQNTPNVGQAADVTVAGQTKLQANAAVAAGASIGTHTNGQGKAIVAGTDVTAYLVGQVIQGCGAANEYVTATVDCFAPARAT